MERVADTYITAKFEEYRNKYPELVKYYEKENKPLSLFGEPLVIKGETFTSHALMGNKFDYAFHNCGKTSYPEYLENNSWYQERESYLNSTQKELARNAFSTFIYKADPFKYEFENYQGLWAWGMSTELTNEQITNSNGGGWNYLGLYVKDYFKIVEDLASLNEFKKITATSNSEESLISLVVGDYNPEIVSRNLRPRDRMGEISNYFMKLFLEENYTCKHFEEKICRLCKEKFFPQMGSEWPGKVPPDYCTICLEMSFSGSTEFFRLLGYSQDERKNNFIVGIKVFSEFFGLIPKVGTTKRRIITQLRQSGVGGEDLDLALMVSSLLPFHETAKKMFGSWAHLLEAAELLEHRQRGHGGHQSIGSDGHLCLSMGERAICEYLTRRGISHSKEPVYPIDKKLNPNGLLRGDFLVGSTFIEFAGMMSKKDYAEKMRQKGKLAKLKGIPWIKVEGSQLEDLDLMLEAIKETEPLIIRERKD
jgi:hypothetical protein